MILLTTFVYVATVFLGFLLMTGYIVMSERWMDSRRAYPSALKFLVCRVCGAVLIGIYTALMARVFDWAGWVSV